MLVHSLEEFNIKADLLMERFRILADGKTVVTLFNEINRAALDIIASVNLFIFFSHTFLVSLDEICDSKKKLLPHKNSIICSGILKTESSALPIIIHDVSHMTFKGWLWNEYR